MSNRNYSGVRTGGPNRLYTPCMFQPPATDTYAWLPCHLPVGHDGPHSVEKLTFRKEAK